MVDNQTAIAQSIMDKIKSQETPIVTEAAVHQAKYVNAILNSKLGRLLLLRTKTVPIPKLTDSEQRSFVQLVDAILKAKAVNPAMDTTELEEKIDWLVYDLYGLTNEETAEVADFFWEGRLTEEEEDIALLRAMEEADISDPNEFVSLGEVMRTLRGLRGD